MKIINVVGARPNFMKMAPITDRFEGGDVPFMMKVFQIHEEKRNEISAVTYVDGSGSLQTVYQDTNLLSVNLTKHWLVS